MKTEGTSRGIASPALERANEEIQRAIFGPATEGASNVAAMLSPFGMSWMAMVPPPLWGSFLGLVYLQGTSKGILEAPKHWMNGMQLYAQAMREGAQATR